MILNLIGGGYQRETVYDWVRLIATLFVVIGHSAYLNIQTTYGGVNYTLPANISSMYNSMIFCIFRYISGWVYGFHMPLFFMLSGAVLGLKPIKSFDSIVRSKLKRLLIPYFVYSWLFMLPVKYLGGFYNKDSLKEAMRGVLSGLDSGHLWFLTALFWCLIVFVLFKKILDKLCVKSIFILLIIGGIIQLTKSYIPFDILGLKTGLGYMFYFALGYIFQIERSLHGNWNNKKVIIALIMLLFIELLNWRYSILTPFSLIIIGSFLTYIIANLCNRLFPSMFEKQFGRIILRNMFYVYIFHDPLEYIVLRFFFSFNLLKSGFGCIAYLISRTVVIVIASITLGEIVRWLKIRSSEVINS